MSKIDSKARLYADSESQYRRHIVGAGFTDYENDVAMSAYKRGYLDALRQVETMAIYSSRDI